MKIAAAVIALGVGLAPAANPTAKTQLAYVQAPFHAAEDNGQG